MSDGGPAFPFTPTDRSGQIGPAHPGMSLRDWFAGQALAGLMGNHRTDVACGDAFLVVASKTAWRAADIMIEQGRMTAEEQSANAAEKRSNLARKAQAIRDALDDEDPSYAYVSARDAMLKAREGGQP